MSQSLISDYRDLLSHISSCCSLLVTNQETIEETNGGKSRGGEVEREKNGGHDIISKCRRSKEVHMAMNSCERHLRFAKGIVNVTEYLDSTAKAYMSEVFAEIHLLLFYAKSKQKAEQRNISLEDQRKDAMAMNKAKKTSNGMSSKAEVSSLKESISNLRVGNDSEGDFERTKEEDLEATDLLLDNHVQSLRFIYGGKHVAVSDAMTTVAASRAILGRYSEAVGCCGQATAIRISSLGLMHSATAKSHFNLGLLYRLHGDLVNSRKHLRISRKILEALYGSDSLQVAKVDISLGQTERLCCNMDMSFLHFYLAFHIRAMVLGPTHADTLRAYQLVSATRFAYKDRLVTSLEVLDRLDELGFLAFEAEENDEDDVAVVMSELVNQVYAIKSSASSKFVTFFGDYLVFRRSHLSNLLRHSISQRIDTRLSRRRRLSAVPSSVQERNRRLHITSSFDSMSNLLTLTEEFVTLLLPTVLSPETHNGLRDAPKSHTEVVPNYLTSSQQQFLLKRFNKRKEGQLKRQGSASSCDDVKPVEKTPRSKEITPDKSEDSTPGKCSHSDTPLDVDVNPKSVDTPSTTHTTSDTSASGGGGKKVTIASPEKNSVHLLPDKEPAEPQSSTSSADSKAKATKKSSAQEVPPSKASSAKPSSPTKKVVQPSASFVRVVENKSNKAFFSSVLTREQKSKSGVVKAVLLPPTGRRNLVISSTATGEKVTIRPTTPADILEAMKTKIYTVGIFPYLLLNDYKKIEKEELDYSANQAVARKRAESSAPDLPPPEPPKDPDPTPPTSQDPPEAQETDGKRSDDVSASSRPVPQPPPLPSSWPPKVENGRDVGSAAAGALPVAGGGMSGLFGALTEGGGGLGVLRKKGGGAVKPAGPKLKQLHWDMLEKVEDTIWVDDRDKANVDELLEDEDDIFGDCAEIFAAAVKKPSAPKESKQAGVLSRAKSKQVAVLDAQKSQNMNIMLAKFGSRRKVSEIIHAIVSLHSSSFALSTVNTMLDYTPASFDSGEIEGIRAAVEREGTEKLGKAEHYLYELSKIPRVENYLRTLVLLLSVDEIKDNIMQNAEAMIKINEEIRGSVRLKVFFRAILRVGNILNEGSKKSGAVAFKISSLSKLTQTKSNDGKTVLQYLAATLDKEMPGILELRKDFESLEAAKHVSFPSLQLDLGKVEAGLKVMAVLEADMRRGLESHAEHVTEEILERLVQRKLDVESMKDSMATQLSMAQTCHAELCAYLGEEAKADPETVYGTLISFVNAVGAASSKRR